MLLALAADADPDAIAADIEATREEMSGTIEAIQERLDPERLTQQATEVTEQAKEAATEITEQAREAAKDVAKYAIEEAKTAVNELTSQAKASVREATIGRVEHMAMYTRDTAESVKGDLFTTIKRNPVPAALAAISIGWLWSHRSGGGSQSSSYARYGNYRGETHLGLELSVIGRRLALLRFIRDRGWLRFVRDHRWIWVVWYPRSPI